MLEVACISFLKFPLCVLSPLSLLSLNLSPCPVRTPQHLHHALLSAVHFLSLPLEDNNFLADFLWGLWLKENRSGNWGANVLNESLTKGLLALWASSYQGCVWKTFIVLLRRPGFQVKVWPATDNIYIMLIAFGQQIAFGNLGIIAITQKKLCIVKRKQFKCDSLQLPNMAILPCLSPCLC